MLNHAYCAQMCNVIIQIVHENEMKSYHPHNQTKYCVFQTKLQSLTTTQKDMVLETVINRSPGLLMDVMAFFEVPPGPEHDDQPAGQPQWCVCGHCREMPTPE